MDIREPVVAGQFYPSSAESIKEQISSFIGEKTKKSNTIACMLPHAGYMYSGKVATLTVSGLNVKEKIILLGPNHTGNGPAFSIMTEGIWNTPLGRIKIDSGLANAILEKSKYLERDTQAHSSEHSLEVELPILQYFRKDFEIVPIIFMSEDYSALKQIGKDIASVIIGLKIQDSCLIVASSDMTHYEPQVEAKEKDKQAIEAILELDSEKLKKKVENFNISMCGYAPAVAMIEAAKWLGAKKAKLIKYQTSGDVTGDRGSVVGYAGITLY